jgi:lipopolysaccharide biosynthesis regulator YciM
MAGILAAKDERIRALEAAERTCKAANESQRKTIAALEAELAECSHRYAEDVFPETAAAVARAEKAEARVKELEPWAQIGKDNFKEADSK